MATNTRKPGTPTAHSRDEGYQCSLELHGRIEALYPRVEQHTAYFRVMMPVNDRAFPQLPGRIAGVRLDEIVCALAIKAATTKRAVLALCELRDGDNALALTRVLLENACLLEWLTRGDGRRRLEAYVMFTSVQAERIAAMIDRHKGRLVAAGAMPEVTSDPYHHAVWTHVFRDTKRKCPTRSSRPTWEFDRTTRQGEPVSVHALFQEIATGEYSYEYDVLYGALGSDIVHSGPFSLLSIQRLTGNRQTFILRSMPVGDTRTVALATSNSAMFLVLDSLTQYIGLDLSAELEALKAKSKEDPYARPEEPSDAGK